MRKRIPLVLYLTTEPLHVDKVRHQLMLPEPGPSGAGVRIAILDTGIDLEHPDFRNIDQDSSQNFAWLSTDIADRCYHGTHIAGIIAGSGAASDRRYRGIAPNAELIILKTSVRGSGLEGDVVAALEAAVEAGADIVNYSAGYSPRADHGRPPWVWPTLRSASEEMFDLVAARGILCVVAAGNDGPEEGSINRPGGLSSVLTVGAVGREGAVLTNSSRGPYRMLNDLPRGGVRRFEPLLDKYSIRASKPDVVAQGENVIAPRAAKGVLVSEAALLDRTDPKCPYMMVSGTSPATAVVTGVAACLLEYAREREVDLGPNTGAALKALLLMSARALSVGAKHDFGAGVLKWAIVTQTLRDFATDEAFRRLVLEGPQIRLLPEDESE